MPSVQGQQNNMNLMLCHWGLWPII